MAKIGFISLGCAKNQVDCEGMMYRVREAGFELSPQAEGCDVVVINTCGFIDAAKSEAIDCILDTARLKEQGLVGKILVTGCLTQRYREEFLRELPEVDGILGTGSYMDIVPAIRQVLSEGRPESFRSIDAPVPESGRILTTPRHYAYLKIAEGCDNHCAFCVIPSLRGKYRSRPMDAVVAEAEGLAADGARELIVVAQDTSRYGTDLPGHQRLLPELLTRLCRIPEVHWVRVHYLYPDLIDDNLIDVYAREPKLVNYMDIPIQHCNDAILKRMCRRGTKEEIRALFAKLRQRLPDLVVRTSIIAGLPGEGEAEFEELCEFLREEKLERAGTFVFSPEEGTPAARMDYPDVEIAQERAQVLAAIQEEIMAGCNAARIGQTLEVLVDGYDEEAEQFYGRTYADSPDIDGRVWLAAEEALTEGTFVRARIDGTVDGDLSGYVVEVLE